MATETVDAKSQTVAARVLHEVTNNAGVVKIPGESVGQFVTAALKREVEHCQQRKAREPEQSPSAPWCKALRRTAMQDNTMTDKELAKTLSSARERRRGKVEHGSEKLAPCAFTLEQFPKEYRERRSLQVWQRTELD